jgi:hypothetical protein
VGQLVRALREEQQAANAGLADALERIERDDLHSRLLALVEEARGL